MHRHWLVAPLLLLVACRNEAPAPTPGAPSTVPPGAPSVAASTPGPQASAPPSTSSKPMGATLGAVLESERTGRPVGGLRAEDVFAALAKEGVVVAEPRQHLGSPVGAKYCSGGSTASGVSMSVCEYADAAAAEAGKATSVKAFGSIIHREVIVRRATTLSILPDPFNPTTEAETKKAIAAFSKL